MRLLSITIALLIIVWILLMTFILNSLVFGQCLPSKLLLFMPDGQDKDHLIKCYVNVNLSESNDPILTLRSTARDQCTLHVKPIAIAPHQSWRMPPIGYSINDVDKGSYVTEYGTLLLFDLSDKINAPLYVASRRFTPILSFKIDGKTYYAVTQHPIAIGNILGALSWAIFIGFVLLLFTGYLAHRYTGTWLGLICNHFGKLSLARTQILCWTVIVASTVFGFGLIEMCIPTIPTSVLALMGLSLATGNIKAILASEWKQLPLGPSHASHVSPKLIHLITDESDHISIAKIQMIMWTVVTLILFIVKSILQAEIWAVPWPMVGMMGMSQLGYLIPDISIRSSKLDENELAAKK